jgi:hypothetical protein
MRKKDMLSIREYATISKEVYGAPFLLPVFQLKNIELVKKLHGLYRVYEEDIDTHVSVANVFFGGFYLKFESGKATNAIIAFRGTVKTNLNNVIEDVYSWYSSAMGTDWHDHMPSYYAQAVNFTRKVFEYLRANFPHLCNPGKIRFTGHSLGAALAQLLSLTHYNAPCVIFNSPVCRNFMTQSGLHNSKLVNNINAHYGFINKVGGVPIGKVQVVDIPQMAPEAESMFNHFNESMFESGKVLSQAGEMNLMTPTGNVEAVAGAAEHLTALLGSGSGLMHLSNEHTELLECEKPYQGNYLTLVGLADRAMGKGYCNAKIILSTMAQTIMAQHDIGHMVTALSNGSKKLGGNLV